LGSAKQDFRANLTAGPVARVLMRLTLPMTFGMFSVIAFNLADTFFVGRLGTLELAALSFTFPVVMALGSLAVGLGVGASSVVAIAIGKGDRDTVRRLTTDSLILAVFVVSILVVIGYLTIDPLFAALGAGPDILPLIREYMRVWYLGMGFVVVPMVGNGCLRAAGDTKTPSIIMMGMAALNFVLDPILIFGLAGFPALGIRGAAIATVAARALSLAAGLYFLHFRDGMLLLSGRSLAGIRSSWRRILEVALPVAAASIFAPLGMGVVTRLLSRFGPEAVAGYGVATRIEAFSLLVLIALSASIGPFVGQNWGAGKDGRVYEALKHSFRFCAGYGIAAAVLLALSGGWIAGLFNPDPRVTAVTALYLWVVPASYALEGILMVVRMSWNALGLAKRAAALTAGRYLALHVPLAWLGAVFLGLPGIFIAGALSNLVAGTAAYFLSCVDLAAVRRDRVAETLAQEII